MAPEPPSPPPLEPPGWNDQGSSPYRWVPDEQEDRYAYGPWGYQPWMEPPPPASRHATARWIVSLLLIGFVIAGTATGVALLISRGSPLSFTTSSGGDAVSGTIAQVDQAVVDVTSRLIGNQGVAAGTGMVINSSGLVLTNNHVIEGGSSVTVQIDGQGPEYNATVVGDDPVNDVALLQMQGVSGLATVTLADSSGVNIGDAVTALGNALGQGGTPNASSGTVTALGQTITVSDEMGGTETLNNLIEMNAPIQRGDSGGPLLNDAGKVIGMDTAAEVGGRRSSSPSTAGYAIPINSAMSIVRQIQQGGGGSVQTGNPPIIGIDVTDAGSANGVPVAGVQSGSPASQAGIVAGDTITSIDGRAVSSATGLRNAIRAHKVGDQIKVGWTDASGQSHSSTLTLIAGPPD